MRMKSDKGTTRIKKLLAQVSVERYSKIKTFIEFRVELNGLESRETRCLFNYF